MTLDEEKREIVLRLLANGNSRRVAARYAGCAPSTITRTAQRDEDFRRRVSGKGDSPIFAPRKLGHYDVRGRRSAGGGMACLACW